MVQMGGHFIEEQSVLSSEMPGASYSQYPPLQHFHHGVDHSHFSPPGLVGEHDLVSCLLMQCSVMLSHLSLIAHEFRAYFCLSQEPRFGAIGLF